MRQLSRAIRGQPYSPAASISSDGFHPSAAAILRTLSRLTLRSPRSILPMCDRSMPAASASVSCERPRAFLRARTARPTCLSHPSLSCCPDTRATAPAVAGWAFYDHGIYDPFVVRYVRPIHAGAAMKQHTDEQTCRVAGARAPRPRMASVARSLLPALLASVAGGAAFAANPAAPDIEMVTIADIGRPYTVIDGTCATAAYPPITLTDGFPATLTNASKALAVIAKRAGADAVVGMTVSWETPNSVGAKGRVLLCGTMVRFK